MDNEVDYREHRRSFIVLFLYVYEQCIYIYKKDKLENYFDIL